MDKTIILELATNAGRIMLENGAETYRVEEIISVIGKNFNSEINSYATLTGIISTIKDSKGNFITNTIRISQRTMNLSKIDEIHYLGKNISEYNLDDLKLKLEIIEKNMSYGSKFNLLAYAIAAGSFTLLFGGNLIEAIFSGINGLIIYLYLKSMSTFKISNFFINGIGSALIAIFSIISLKFNFVHSIDKVIIGSLMLLVPGMALTNAVRDVINGDLMAGMARGLEAFFIAASLAVGSGIILAIFL